MVNPKEKVIIVIDKDRDSRYKSKDILSREGFFVLCCENLTIAEEYCIHFYPDIVIFKNYANTKPIINFCTSLKISRPKTKIIILSTIFDSQILSQYLRNTVEHLLKIPYTTIELITVIKKLLSITPDDTYLQFHNLKLNKNRGKLYLKDFCINLSKKEIDVLEILIKRGGEVDIKKISSILQSKEPACRVCINRLRKKLLENTGMEVIKCRYSVGYYIAI